MGSADAGIPPTGVPRVMSTQHPDNAISPDFARADGVIAGEGEVVEAGHVFATLGCDEQMWDYEGKAADVDVVLKLLTLAPDFFESRVLGRDVFLTLRIPNPSVEASIRKKVSEALHSIVTSHDVASEYYGYPAAPIFEVILPVTRSAEEVLAVEGYYRRFVAGVGGDDLPGGGTVSGWLGEALPNAISVIPLVEDANSLLKVDDIAGRYVQGLEREASYVRVFLARSDPALNYGSVAATLLVKMGLERLSRLESRLGVPVYPIVGAGCSPFRGNLRPPFVENVLDEYPSAQTFTVQSSFKYDYDRDAVQRAVGRLKNHQRTSPIPMDEERAMRVVEKTRRRYQAQVAKLAEMVGELAVHVPPRRQRRLHIGLFGYSREAGDEEMPVHLPRAITFAAALYSVGVPPEALGADALDDDDMAFLREAAPHFEDDLAEAFRFANGATVEKLLGPESARFVRKHTRTVDREHASLTHLVFDWASRDVASQRYRQVMQWAAESRGFLG